MVILMLSISNLTDTGPLGACFSIPYAVLCKLEAHYFLCTSRGSRLEFTTIKPFPNLFRVKLYAKKPSLSTSYRCSISYFDERVFAGA
jgi:hypothetical protein